MAPFALVFWVDIISIHTSYHLLRDIPDKPWSSLVYPVQMKLDRHQAKGYVPCNGAPGSVYRIRKEPTMDKKILLSTVLVPAIINSLSADQLPVFVVGMVVTYYLLKKDN